MRWGKRGNDGCFAINIRAGQKVCGLISEIPSWQISFKSNTRGERKISREGVKLFQLQLRGAQSQVGLGDGITAVNTSAECLSQIDVPNTGLFGAGQRTGRFLIICRITVTIR